MKNDCPFTPGQRVWLAGNRLRTRQLVTFVKSCEVPIHNGAHVRLDNGAHVRLDNGEYHCVYMVELQAQMVSGYRETAND